jgi:hypothetical protein
VLPVAVHGVTVLPGASGQSAARWSEPWLLRDAAGRAMPVAASPEVCWALLAVSAGRPVDVVGEWDGFLFTPQAAAPAGQAGRLLA